MLRDRRDMTVRVVRLHSREAGEALVGGTAADRLALFARLSERLWALTHQPLPAYSRSTMPIVITPLRPQSERDQVPVVEDFRDLLLPPYRIDILTGVSGVSFEEAWNERVEDQFE